MFKKIIQTKRFWTSVALFTAEFIVLFNLVRIAVEFKFRFRVFFDAYFNAEVFPSFAVFNIIVGLLFGLATAYSRFWRHYKNNA